jgi:hypothetical protein
MTLLHNDGGGSAGTAAEPDLGAACNLGEDVAGLDPCSCSGTRHENVSFRKGVSTGKRVLRKTRVLHPGIAIEGDDLADRRCIASPRGTGRPREGADCDGGPDHQLGSGVQSHGSSPLLQQLLLLLNRASTA